MSEVQASTSSTAQLPTYGELIDRSWKSIRDQLPLAAGLSLVVMFATYVAGKIPYNAGFFINSVISVGYVACLLKLRKKEEFSFGDFFWAFKSMNRFLNVVVMSLLSALITVIGLVLLVLPGLYAMVALWLSSVVIVQENLGGVDALQRSRELVRGYWWYMAGALGIFIGLNILGALCFLVGLLFSLPVSMLLIINLADALKQKKGLAGGPTPTTETTPSSFAVNP